MVRPESLRSAPSCLITSLLRSQSSESNSVAQKKDGDKLLTERYYNEKGEPYLDIDYTDHGNPIAHPIVPHKRNITLENGHIKRGKQEKIE